PQLVSVHMLLWCSFHPCFCSFKQSARRYIITLSLHDALPISAEPRFLSAAQADLVALVFHGLRIAGEEGDAIRNVVVPKMVGVLDRKSTRLNSSHVKISYAVFCLKKKRRIR